MVDPVLIHHDEMPENPSDAVVAHPRDPARHPRTLRVFKRLRAGQVETVEHGLGAFPITDVYALAYFPVVAHEDQVTGRTWVNFYALHGNDASVTFGGPKERVVLRRPNPREHGIPLIPLLRELGVSYDQDTHLGSVMSDLWSALFAPPSDPFDETSYTASPWINTCCGDRRSMGDLRRGGSLDDLWLYFRPYKTINYPRAGGGGSDPRLAEAGIAHLKGNVTLAMDLYNQVLAGEKEGGGGTRPLGVPAQVEVTQVDYGTLALRLLPPYDDLYAPNPDTGDPGVPAEVPIARDELNVMLLLHA